MPSVPRSYVILHTSNFPKPSEHDHEGPTREQIRGAREDRNSSRRKLSKKREHLSLSQKNEEQRVPSARVITTEGPFYVLRLEDGSELRARTYKGTRSANPNSTLVAIGDQVRVAGSNEEANYEKDNTADILIEEVLPRRTKLSRRAAGRRESFEQVIVANVDLLVIVASVGKPKLRSGIIDRYIVAGVEGGLDIVIAINKIDNAPVKEMDEASYFKDVYEEIGYPVYLLSAISGARIGELKEVIAGKTSVFAGHSGVGKSSLINAILGREAAQTGALQRKFKGGAHTTAASTLIEIPLLSKDGRTYIADTPGVREFANFDLDPQNLKFAFVEFQKFQERCAIPNCSHIHEPGCAVRQALEDDLISIDRYSNYQKLFEEAKKEELTRLYNQ
jgi:ribosome biogenesis GTPase / thiamine phosphate phosphatase